MYKRRVYSVIDVLGDIGGLKEALSIVSLLLVAFYAQLSKERTMISHNFQYIDFPTKDSKIYTETSSND
jgi:hypothetical protein